MTSRRPILPRHAGTCGLLPCLALFAAACLDPAQGPPPDFSVSLEPEYQWSGGSVHLTAAAFAAVRVSPTWPVVVIDNDTVTARWVDDSTVAVHLPQRPSGRYDVAATLPDGSHGAASVQLVGLRRRYDAADLSLGRMIPWGAFEVLAFGGVTQAPVAIDVRTGDTRTFAGVSGSPRDWTLMSPGPSFEPGTAVLAADGHPPHAAWRLEAGPAAAIRTVGCHPDPVWPSYELAYEVVEVAPGRCLGVWPDSSQLVHGSGAQIWTDGRTTPLSAIPYMRFEAFVSFRFSPDRTRLVPVGPTSAHWTTPESRGWPVFNQDPDVAYFLRAKAVPGAAFSASGDTLVVAAADSIVDYRYIDWSVRLYAAADGREIARIMVPDAFEIQDVLVDPVFPRIYALGLEAESRADDRATYVFKVWSVPDLTLVASVETEPFFWDRPGVLTYGGSGGRIYYVANVGDWAGPWPGQSLEIFEFDLLYP
ncbi:MAG: hypothetical protein OER90_20950 [Gemmatimonadota bacterium]|nr:hypothetical protein [Gemmatimonadota bacterium]